MTCMTGSAKKCVGFSHYVHHPTQNTATLGYQHLPLFLPYVIGKSKLHKGRAYCLFTYVFQASGRVSARQQVL